MRTVDYPSTLKWRPASGPRITALLSWLRAAVLFILPALFLQGSAFAERERNSFPDFAGVFEANGGQLWTRTGLIPGERPVYADFDGDHESDLVRGLLVEDHYEVLVSLSTRSDVIILRSPVQLAGFTIHALDINHDSYPDVVAISPTTPHPLAVWLGDGQGNFKSADRKLFGTDPGFTQSSEYQSGRFLPDPESWTEPLYPVCEPSMVGYLIQPPKTDRTIASVRAFYSAPREYSRTAPRSPPALSV